MVDALIIQDKFAYMLQITLSGKHNIGADGFANLEKAVKKHAQSMQYIMINPLHPIMGKKVYPPDTVENLHKKSNTKMDVKFGWAEEEVVVPTSI